MKAERGWDNAPRPGYAAPMSTSPTVLVVGSGLTGSTVARALARADVSSVELAQGAMVVSHGREFPFIRIHETKHASRQQVQGTVLGFESTNAPGRIREALDVSDEALATLRVTA